jgi:hypothetical protein
VAKYSRREYLRELAELKKTLRADIQAYSSGTDQDPAAVRERRRRVLTGDFRFFAYHYFPHHIRGESSLFQAHFCHRFPQILANSSGAREWWIAPRGEAKSSLLTKIGPIWIAVQALWQRQDVRTELELGEVLPPYNDYVILLGAETRLPTKLLEVIKTELTVNPGLLQDFPEVCGRGGTWRVGDVVTRTGVKIEPFGAEQAIRGTFHGASRPKVLLGDDLITDSEAKSPTERDNRWNWLMKAIDYLGPPDGSVKYLGVGTILNKDDPISRAKKTIGHVVHHFRAIEALPENMDLWQQCQEIMLNSDKAAQDAAAELGQILPDNRLPSYLFYLDNRDDMDAGARTSWPSVRSLFWLMRQRATNGRAFATEMQGDPRDNDDRVFTNIRFWVQRLHHWRIFGACDPSLGRGQGSDPSAILVGGYDTEKYRLQLIHAEMKRRLFSKLESDLIAVQREFGCIAIGFENNVAFEHSRQAIMREAQRQGVLLPLVGVTSVLPLDVRVDQLEPFINDAMEPRILFHPGLTQLLHQLDTWPEPQSGHHYDGLSALQILWMLCISRGNVCGFESAPVRGSHNAAHSDPFLDDAADDSDRGLW